MDRETQEAIKKAEARIFKIERKLDGISPREEIITGTTSSTANAKKTFAHTLARRPSRIFNVYGNVYVYDHSERLVDIRSTQTSVNFKIIIS